MNRLVSLLAFVAALPCAAQNFTLDLVGEVDFPATSSGNGTSDVWGYTAPDGAEYAIVGVRDGTAIVSVPDLEILHTIPGPTRTTSTTTATWSPTAPRSTSSPRCGGRTRA